MNDFTSRPPAERFARIVRGVHHTLLLLAAGSRLAGPLLFLLSRRLRFAADRVLALAARLEAGTLRLRAPRARPAPSRRPAPADPAQAPPELRLPRGFAWLLRRVPGIGFGRSQLTFLLAQPDMAALVAAAPPVARHIRPICRMLGVKPPPGLFPPRPPRRRRPKPSAREATPRPPHSDKPPERKTGITGPPAAKLFVASSASDADLFLTVPAFAPDGREAAFRGTVDPHASGGGNARLSDTPWRRSERQALRGACGRVLGPAAALCTCAQPVRIPRCPPPRPRPPFSQCACRRPPATG